MALARADSDNSALEFHDSTVASIQIDRTTLTISFSQAYVHRSEGIPGVDAGTGWSQGAVMVLFGTQLSGEVPKLPCSLSHGSVTVDCEVYDGTIPVPLVHVGGTQVILSFEDGSEIQITADELRLKTVGDSVYVESFPG